MAKIVQGLADMGNSMMPGFFPSLSCTVVHHGAARVIDDTPWPWLLIQSSSTIAETAIDCHSFLRRSCNIADPVGFKTPTAINRHSAHALRAFPQLWPTFPG